MLLLVHAPTMSSVLSPSTFLLRRCATTGSLQLLKRASRSKTTSVRVIVQKDLPHGKAYPGDVVNVKAGFARNFLIPQKYAVYATRLNFERLGLFDPERLDADDLAAGTLKKMDLDQKAADILRHYLRNKTVRTFVRTKK